MLLLNATIVGIHLKEKRCFLSFSHFLIATIHRIAKEITSAAFIKRKHPNQILNEFEIHRLNANSNGLGKNNMGKTSFP